MDTDTEASPNPEPAGPPASKRRWWARILASKFLVVSIAVHLLFGAGATLYVVQRYSAKRKMTFQGGPPASNQSKRAMEHKVSMAKKKNSMSAPAQARRISTSGLAKFTLPEMPAMPTATMVTANKMPGMGGMGMGTAPGGGMGGGGTGGGGGGGGGLTTFGFRNGSAGGLAGQFYDLKQTRDRKPSSVDGRKYGQIVAEFITKGWPESAFNKFYKAPKALFAVQFLIPDMDAKNGPAAFDVEKEVKPERWVCLYKGTVVAPETGTFHFVGGGDDILFVKFGGKTVLNACWYSGDFPGKSEARYDYGWPQAGGFAKGDGFHVEAGQTYPIEILVGEWPGNKTHFVLLIEKDGGAYEKGPNGSPILPAFRMADVKAPKLEADQTLPPHRDDGPIWRARSAGTGSILDSLRR